MQTWLIVVIVLGVLAFVAKKLIGAFLEVVIDEDRSTYPVVGQLWERTIADEGIVTDGWSLHRNEAQRKQFVAQHWELLSPDDNPPSNYCRPVGNPFVGRVARRTYEKVKGGKLGYRDYQGSSTILGIPVDIPMTASK